MADEMEIIISAVDNASEAFKSVISSTNDMSSEVENAMSSASDSMSEMENTGGVATTNIVQEFDEMGNVVGMTYEYFDEAGNAVDEFGNRLDGLDPGPINNEADAADNLEKELEEAVDAMNELGSAGDVMVAQTFLEATNSMKDSMLSAADTAGTFNDSMMRAGLEAEGAGISVDEMKNMINGLSESTGRAGGQIRESFIKAMARGVTDSASFTKMMEGAGAQATLLGTDIQTMGDKFSSMAQKDTLMNRALAETGITMDELATAMGMTGATADEVKAKWKSLDTNQRAAILGTAASMNEGQNANNEYKRSWAGLKEQVEIAKGRLLRIAGSVLLPVLIPAMQIASDVLTGVGDAIQGVMNGPLGGLVSVLGSAAGAFAIAVTGAAALRNFLGFLRLETMFSTAATVMNTIANAANAEGSTAAALGNAILSTSFMEEAAAAWAAAAGVIAATWPLLVIIGVIALVVAAIYEVGKAFGWWTDFGSMIDAVKAGIQRLWDAFVNHPDVQAFIQALTDAWNWLSSAVGDAWNAVLEFFGIADSGEFDVVAALIKGIGDAWTLLTAPIRTVIIYLEEMFGAFYRIATGQQDVQTAFAEAWQNIITRVWPIMNQLIQILGPVVQAFISAAIQAGVGFVRNILVNIAMLPGRILAYLLAVNVRIIVAMARWIVTAAVRARQFVLRILNVIRSLPGQFLALLLRVVSAIVSAGHRWVQSAAAAARSVVTNVISRIRSLPGDVASALSGVAGAFVRPFQDAWNRIQPILDSIKNGIAQIAGAAGGDAAGGDIPMAAGGEPNPTELLNVATNEYLVEHDENITVDENITLTLDLKNVPSHIDERTLISMLNDKKVIKSIVENREFQRLDQKVKQRILAKTRRARGV